MPAFLPPVFVSHGSPMLVLDAESPGHAFLAGLGRRLERPAAILAVSAHWTTRRPMVSGAVRPDTIHDFYGFPEPLYRLTYPAPGAPALAERVMALLDAAGMAGETDAAQGLDHGAWVPLRLMYPQADIPVAQLSVQPHSDAAAHLALGRALAPLAHEGVLVLGSGGAVHNLHDFRRGDRSGPAPWAAGFAGWLDGVLAAGDAAALAAWSDAPDARTAHPTDEHFLPLPVAFGAAGPDARGEPLHAGFEHGNLGMHAWAFRPADGSVAGST
ncbi:DODA-type extradiol aromatic ring-opening family dioxygenase [Azospirillum halopraeferens]|uniref:DODA-type extradiol aromatic ring-opening family dioxygenase n=1 Tax=Azospirillum halopraeferens TaxID=34010 RepID=UPI000421D1FE|nr:class III extradiol ring-cleavage dioxygenase [Azospirillum halopraeferens]